MRGKVAAPVAEGVKRGITPAYAGKSGGTGGGGGQAWDPPRLCGEKGRFLPAYTALMGSPPPMRGKEMNLFLLLH